jgi:hypothetical protein
MWYQWMEAVAAVGDLEGVVGDVGAEDGEDVFDGGFGGGIWEEGKFAESFPDRKSLLFSGVE